MISINNSKDISLHKSVIGKFDIQQKKQYDKLSNAYYYLNQKFENSLKKITTWNKPLDELKLFEINIFDKKGNSEKINKIEKEDILIDDIELFLFRIRDLLDLLFCLTSLITEITNKGKSLSRNDTTKILKRLEKENLVNYDFDLFIKEALEGIKIIIDVRNSLKLNGTAYLTFRNQQIYYSQRKDNIKSNPLRSQSLRTLGENLFDNWLISLNEFKETMPNIIHKYVFVLNNIKLN